MKTRTSLTLEDCGNFAAIKEQPENIKTLHIATVYGFCTALAERKTADKLSTYNAMQGQFRIKPASGEAVEGGLLIFPASFLTLMVKPLEKLKTTPGVDLAFAYDLAAVRAKNDAGFTINFDPRHDPVVGNRLDEFVSLVDRKKK